VLRAGAARAPGHGQLPAQRYDDIIVSINGMKMSFNRVWVRRNALGWSQAELAERVGISRTAVSAIEGDRLSPSVATALALAEILGCSVEELFGKAGAPGPTEPEWAWRPHNQCGRYWEAEVGRRRLLYPVEAAALHAIPHDGIWEEGIFRERDSVPAETTLTLATCDPAAGVLASEYARSTGFRLLVFQRGGSQALELLHKGVIHIAALHRSTGARPRRNAETVRERLGGDFCLLRAAEWEEGLALPPENQSRVVASVARRTGCWAGREVGSGARECLEELLEGRRFVGREVSGHNSVAEAVRSGWAEAGVCVRFSAEEAGLNFLPVRQESLDFCFATSAQRDRRVQGLVRLLRSRRYRRLVSEMPGFDARNMGQLMPV
jgi:putative molybdopterin biosynthesis protein